MPRHGESRSDSGTVFQAFAAESRARRRAASGRALFKLIICCRGCDGPIRDAESAAGGAPAGAAVGAAPDDGDRPISHLASCGAVGPVARTRDGAPGNSR